MRTVVICLAFLVLSIAKASYGQALTRIDSSSIWPKRLFIPLLDSSALIHQVQAQVAIDSYLDKSIIAVELFNCLLPIDKNNLHSFPEAVKYISIGDTLLISMSVLSDKKGNIVWQPVKLDTIPAYRLCSLAEQFSEAAHRLTAYRQAGNPQSHLLTTRINTFPIVKRQGCYWTPESPVLTQYFLIRTHKTTKLNNNDYITINIGGPILSFNAPWRTINGMYTNSKDYPWSRTLPIGIIKADVQQGIYKFWSRISYTITDPTARHHGVGTFLYKPGIGLLFGSYPSYYSITNDSQLTKLNKLIIDTKYQ